MNTQGPRRTFPGTRRYAGSMLIYATVVFTLLLAFASLAVDYGRVQIAKSEILRAADASARYAVTGINDSTAVSKGVAAAADNEADGTTVAVNPEDVVVGHWYPKATPQFSASLTPYNAVQVSVARSAARNNGVPLLFASLLGKATCDVHVVVVAKIGPAVPTGWIGLQNFTVQNNMVSASYDSSVDTTPESKGLTSNSGMIGSNTSVTAKNNEVAGLVVLGPGATTNLSLPSSPTMLSSPIPTPVLDFSAAPATNPGGVSQDLVVVATTTLPSGVYYFTSITMLNNSDLEFSGPATVYVDGNVIFNSSGSITAFDRIPANLHILQRGAGTVFGGPNANNVSLVAAIDAPDTDFSAWNCPGNDGRGTFKSINVKNNAEFYYDESLQAAMVGYGQTVTSVK